VRIDPVAASAGRRLESVIRNGRLPKRIKEQNSIDLIYLILFNRLYHLEDAMPDQHDDRREFLKTCGKFAAVTPPTITLLLSTSLTSDAIAQSGARGVHHHHHGNNGKGNGGGDGSPNGKPDKDR